MGSALESETGRSGKAGFGETGTEPGGNCLESELPEFSCEIPSSLKGLWVVPGFERCFVIVNSGEALPELPITTRIVSDQCCE